MSCSTEGGPYKNYFDNPTISDLKLRLSDGSIVCVHRIVLCTRSEYFDKLITSGFMETDSKEIELRDDQPSAVLAMLRFLYDLSYDSDKAYWNDNRTLLQHARVYTVAEKYGIEGLRESVFETMEPIISEGVPRPDLLPSIREIITGTSSSDYMARPLMINYCVDNLVTLSKNEDFIALLGDLGELGVAIITKHVAMCVGPHNVPSPQTDEFDF